jgi:aldehyde:ferredoxin oxidoreductase
VSTFNAVTKGAMIFEDSLGVCRFNTRYDVPHLVRAVNAASGWDMDVDEAMRAGTRTASLLRAFNILHGIGPELDAPSSRYGSAPKDGPASGVSIQPFLEDMLANYYQLLGWDQDGVPTREKLEALNIGHVADDLGL